MFNCLLTEKIQRWRIKILREYFPKDFQGTLIFLEDDNYEDLRKIWNGLYDKYPAAIAMCNSVQDVITAVNYVRKNKMVFSVRGGGHDYAGNSVCENGLVIDLSPMNNIEVDPDSKTAVVQGGARVGELDAASQKYGLAVPTGTVSSIGIGGMTLGGGSGYLSRKLGLTLDNLIAVELVTAEGKFISADEHENPDLFWGIRGGGGNFGVVTSFKFQLHRIGPEVLSFQSYFRHEDSRMVLQFYRDFMKKAPDELQCFAFFLNVPPVEPFPEEFYGRTTCALIACYSGEPEEGKEVLKPLEELGKPFLKFLQKMEYTSLQKSFDAGMPKGLRWFSRGNYLQDLSDEAIDILCNFTEELPGPFTMAYLEPQGGALSRETSQAKAFPHRDDEYGLHIFPGWSDPSLDEKNINWAKEFHKEIGKMATGGVYINLLGKDETDRIRQAYGGNYDRLVRIKSKWDPQNIFKVNHNIPPAQQAG